ASKFIRNPLKQCLGRQIDALFNSLLELYFDTCWHGDCQERGKEMTPRNFRKWARAQGGRYWWRVLLKRHARRDKRGRPCR
ncbi:hypothetical protein, partial [Burkholderia ubonensis]|uniref:hypothetical protein n=1 Tax=Burkholderia ubonensis TaxID=101571 RepID=UPI001E45347B